MAGSPAAGEEVTEGYEQLRRRVLAAGPDAWRFGRGLVAGRGVAAWVGAWAAHDIPAATGAAGRTAPPVSPAPQEGGETGTTGRAPPPADGGGDLVAVLAQMALAHARTPAAMEGDSR